MLTQVLALLEQHHGGLGLHEISRRLDVPASALDGMLALLVHKGRLVKVDPNDTACAACPLHGECNLLAGRQPRYVPIRRRPELRACAGVISSRDGPVAARP
jgi:hypothetical protein